MGWRRAALWTALLAVPTGSALADPGEFTLHEVTSAQQPINRLKQAYQLLDGKFVASDNEDFSSPLIDFFSTSGNFRNLRFPDNVPFPTGDSTQNHKVAVGITAQVEIPTAGEYSFGLTGNEQARLVINGKAVRIGRGASLSTRIRPIQFDHAGEYSLRMTYIERPGRSALELYSSPGKFHAFHARKAEFQLVGDFANGGLALAPTTPVVSDPSSGGTPAAGGGTTGAPSPIVVGSNNPISAGTATTTGLLSTDSENWQGGGTYLWKINDLAGTAGNADGWDELSMPALTVSSVSSDSPFTIKLQSFNGTVPGTPRGLEPGASGGVTTWTIAHSDAQISINDTPQSPQNLLAAGLFSLDTRGFTVNNTTASPSDFQLQLVDVPNGQDIQLVYSPAPEPTTTLLLAAGIAPMLARRRRAA